MSATTLLLTIEVDGRLCGVPVSRIRDVMRCERIAAVPLAPDGVAGVLNLRGRIVTAVDLRVRLGLAPAAPDAPRMNVVVEEGGELYSLLADEVGEVLSLPAEAREEVPQTLRGPWREHAVAVHRLEDRLLVELDPRRILAIGRRVEAAA
ncbi:MAG: chemotaxis protein CheW [Acetobacteraceae bacterium]|nr:chemotaxis protein CheW [Acetobacteraceae bacterium]